MTRTSFASRAVLAAAAACVALMPVAAHANTRAGDSGALFLAPLSVQIVGDDDAGKAAWYLDQRFLALLAGITFAGIIFAIDNGEDQSPGT